MDTYRQGGYALDVDENEDHIRCAVAPIRDMFSEIIAAVSVSAAQCMTRERIKTFKKYVICACLEISRRFGYRGWVGLNRSYN